MKQIFYSGQCICSHCQDRLVHGMMDTDGEFVLGLASEVYPVNNLKLRNRTIAREDSPVRKGPAKKWEYGRNAPSIDPNVVTIIAVEVKEEPMDQDCPDLDHIQPPPLLISKSNVTPAAGTAPVVLDQMHVTPAASASGFGRTKRGHPPPRPKRENPRRQPQKLGRYVSGRGVKKIDWDKLLANSTNSGSQESQASDSDTESQPSEGFKGFSDNEANEVQALAVKSKPPPSSPPPPTSFTFLRNELVGFLEQTLNAVGPDPFPRVINPCMKVRPHLLPIAPPPQQSPARRWPRFNAPNFNYGQNQSQPRGDQHEDVHTIQPQMRQCVSVGSQYDPEDIHRGEAIRREAQLERQVLNDALDLQDEMYERLGMDQPENFEIDLGLVNWINDPQTFA